MSLTLSRPKAERNTLPKFTGLLFQGLNAVAIPRCGGCLIEDEKDSLLGVQLYVRVQSPAIYSIPEVDGEYRVQLTRFEERVVNIGLAI